MRRSERLILAALTVAVVAMCVATIARSEDWSPFATALAGAVAGAIGATWYWKELWR